VNQTTGGGCFAFLIEWTRFRVLAFPSPRDFWQIFHFLDEKNLGSFALLRVLVLDPPAVDTLFLFVAIVSLFLIPCFPLFFGFFPLFTEDA
jgi:hypothetical protein